MQLEQKQIAVYYQGKREGVFLIDLPEIQIGRGGDAQIDLARNPLVSRQHAVISATPRGHFVSDLGTVNGTRVNGQLISKLLLRDGDEIVIGEHALLYGTASPDALSLAASFSGWGAKTTIQAAPNELDHLAGQQEKIRQARIERILPGGDVDATVLSATDPNLVGSGYRCAIQVPAGGLFSGGVLGQIIQGNEGWVISPMSNVGKRIVVDGQLLEQAMLLEDGDLIEFGGVQLQFFVQS